MGTIDPLDENEGDRKTLQADTEEAAKAVFLDPWLSIKGDPLAALVDHLMEITAPPPERRIRSIRRDAAERKRFLMGNIVSNLVHLVRMPRKDSESHLAVPTAKTKSTRYDRKDYPQRMVGETLDALAGAGIIIRRPAIFKRRTTTIAPTPHFVDLMERYQVRLSDIGRDAGGETIVLRARVDDGDDDGRKASKVLISYTDTDETIRLRTEVEWINEVLNEAGIAYGGEPVPPITLCRVFLLRSVNDPHAFNLNGRLWNGFWQTIKKDKRHLITIGGEDIADLDYSGMFAALAYLRQLGRLPEGDPYLIPGLEEHRDGSKLALLSLLNRKGPMKLLAPKLKAELPDGWTAWMVEEAMTTHHQTIAPLFGKDVGVELMHLEGEILLAVLLKLVDLGIPALPMHDGINVRVSDKEAALEVMQSVSEQMLGVALIVKEKPIWRPQHAD